MSIGYGRLIQESFFACDVIPPSLLHTQAFEVFCHWLLATLVLKISSKGALGDFRLCLVLGSRILSACRDLGICLFLGVGIWLKIAGSRDMPAPWDLGICLVLGV